MRIDVFSDVVCPWCFIGKRRLDAVLAGSGLTGVEVRWHAFQLNPDLPPEGMERRQYLEQKFGAANVARMHERVEAAGREAGIGFRFDRINRSPNTFDAHRLLCLAADQGRQTALKEALLSAYFLEGRDVGDHATLAAIGAETGLQGDVLAWLASDGAAEAVRTDLAAAVDIGIGGVPFFIFAGRYALAGAQPAEVFQQALAAATALPAAGGAGPIG